MKRRTRDCHLSCVLRADSVPGVQSLFLNVIAALPLRSGNVSERLGFRFSRPHDQRNQALVAVGQKRRDAFADPLEEKIDRLVADRQVPYRDAVYADR